jgi:nucleotide-binding universal stress UspA family protein
MACRNPSVLQHADLLVVGGFGHAPWREAMFGGAAHTFIEHAELPVFIVH